MALSSRELLKEIGYDVERLNIMTDEECEVEVIDIYKTE